VDTAFSWLDVKLGMRMMRKYPGVSLAIVFALTIGIPVSLLPNHLIESALGQSPPFDEGERVVGVIGIGQDGRSGLRVGDYEILRERVRTFASLGAVIPAEVNVVSSDGWSEGEAAALMTATILTLARVQPIMGRALLAFRANTNLGTVRPSSLGHVLGPPHESSVTVANQEFDVDESTQHRLARGAIQAP
jgi:hypothetical protein